MNDENLRAQRKALVGLKEKASSYAEYWTAARAQRKALVGLKEKASSYAEYWTAAVQELDHSIEQIDAMLDEPRIANVDQTYIRWPS